jgi:DNA-binding response OmpR family regulator
VEIKPKEYEVADYFAENKGRVPHSREQILEKVGAGILLRRHVAQ